MAGAFPIRVVVQRTGLTARQVRHYEEMGLLAPERSSGRQRLYRAEDIERLLKIRDLLARGLSLAQVRAWLDRPPDASAYHGERAEAMRLTSLYPVSDRAELERVIDERLHKEERR